MFKWFKKRDFQTEFTNELQTLLDDIQNFQKEVKIYGEFIENSRIPTKDLIPKIWENDDCLNHILEQERRIHNVNNKFEVIKVRYRKIRDSFYHNASIGYQVVAYTQTEFLITQAYRAILTYLELVHALSSILEREKKNYFHKNQYS